MSEGQPRSGFLKAAAVLAPFALGFAHNAYAEQPAPVSTEQMDVCVYDTPIHVAYQNVIKERIEVSNFGHNSRIEKKVVVLDASDGEAGPPMTILTQISNNEGFFVSRGDGIIGVEVPYENGDYLEIEPDRNIVSFCYKASPDGRFVPDDHVVYKKLEPGTDPRDAVRELDNLIGAGRRS